jgi:hypothetical protein
MPNLLNMNVHSVICSCSVELKKIMSRSFLNSGTLIVKYIDFFGSFFRWFQNCRIRDHVLVKKYYGTRWKLGYTSLRKYFHHLKQILCKIKLLYIFSLLWINYHLVKCPEIEYKNYLHLAFEILLQDSDLLLESPESSCNIMQYLVHRYAPFFRRR